jgi:hypothetical protein
MRKVISGMNILKTIVPVVAVICVLLPCSAPAQTGGPYELSWSTIDGGGGQASGGPYVLTGTIGQPDAAYSSGGDYELLGGFWPGGPVAIGCATCLGDLDGNNFVMMSDLFGMIAALGSKGTPYIIAPGDPLWNDCADMDGNGFMMMSDLFTLIAMLGQAGPPYIIPCP